MSRRAFQPLSTRLTAMLSALASMAGCSEHIATIAPDPGSGTATRGGYGDATTPDAGSRPMDAAVPFGGNDVPTTCTLDRFDTFDSQAPTAVGRARITESWELRVTASGGAETVVYRFRAPPNVLTVDAEAYGPGPYSTLYEAGDWIAAQVSWPLTDGTRAWETVLVSPANEVRWVGSGTDRSSLSWLGSAGHLVLLHESGRDITVVTPSGATREFFGMRPIDHPDGEGVIPVEVRNPNGAAWDPFTLAWLDANTGSSIPFARAFPLEQSYVPRSDGRFIYLVDGGHGADIAVESRSDARVIAVGASLDARMTFCDGSWAALTQSASAIVVNLISGAVEEFSLPTDILPIGYAYYSGMDVDVDEAGRPLVIAHNDYAAGLFAIDTPMGEWNLLGRGFRDVMEVSYFGIGGTYVVEADDRSIYAPGFTSAEAPDERDAPLSGAGRELLRPKNGVDMYLPLTWQALTLSRDGLCLRFEDSSGLFVLDVANGSIHGPFDDGASG